MVIVQGGRITTSSNWERWKPGLLTFQRAKFESRPHTCPTVGQTMKPVIVSQRNTCHKTCESLNHPAPGIPTMGAFNNTFALRILKESRDVE